MSNRNRSVVGFRCISCDEFYSIHSTVADNGLGCPRCAEEGYPASVRIEHRKGGFSLPAPGNDARMAKFGNLLAYGKWPTLGEVFAPFLDLERVISRYGIRRSGSNNTRLRAFYCGGLPTGSHKDLMSPLACARALDLGRESVTCASSGNAGASLAAYAACSGLACKVYSTKKITPSWKAAICEPGAELIVTETADERWVQMRRQVEEGGSYPVTNFLSPPVGSNPFGVEGYQTVAWEIIYQTRGHLPSDIIVPTARGDLLWGIWHGFVRAKEAGKVKRVPRIHAVEPGTRLEAVLAGADYRDSFGCPTHKMSSIGGNTVTYQSYLAVSQSGGTAVTVSDAEALQAKRELARAAGLFVELSAAASWAAVPKLQARETIGSDADVLLILTSNGYKDVDPDLYAS